ncbi:hypothetical protein B0J17DRAFT_632888, partial [Rhizoctonia solani]
WNKEFDSIDSTLRQLTLMDVGVRLVPAPPRRKRRVRRAVFLGATLASTSEVISESDPESSGEEDPSGGRPLDKRRCIGAERKIAQSLGRDAAARSRLDKLTQSEMLVSRFDPGRLSRNGLDLRVDRLCRSAARPIRSSTSSISAKFLGGFGCRVELGWHGM